MKRLPVSGIARTAILTVFWLYASSASALDFSTFFSDLYSFGDSLVDGGNAQLAQGGPGSPDDPTPAGIGYFDGRFSNGPVVSDRLNEAIKGTGNFTVPSLVGGNNFAFGGARARDNSPADPIPDLDLQAGDYLVNRLGGTPTADPNALYVINAGGNDVLDITLGQLTGPARKAVVDAAAASISNTVSALQGAGAQHILVLGVANVGSVPAVPPGFLRAVASSAARQLNTEIQAQLPAGALYYNTYAFTLQLANDPTQFGLPAGTIFDVDCISAGQAPSGCESATTPYAFFDPIHPASIVNDAAATDIIQFVSATIPEPGTGILMMMGLAGLSMRRRAA